MNGVVRTAPLLTPSTTKWPVATTRDGSSSWTSVSVTSTRLHISRMFCQSRLTSIRPSYSPLLVLVASALAPGINALKTYDPPLAAIDGQAIAGVRRRGKHLIVDITGELALLIHLMSAGRLQLFDRPAGLRDRTSRLLVRLGDGREL